MIGVWEYETLAAAESHVIHALHTGHYASIISCDCGACAYAVVVVGHMN